jgi:hypothetical protein
MNPDDRQTLKPQHLPLLFFYALSFYGLELRRNLKKIKLTGAKVWYEVA